MLTGSAKGEGGLRSAGAVEGGAVGLATAAAAAARARCVSNDAGVLPWTRSGPRQEWESDRASKRASEREREQEARKHKRQETKTADGQSQRRRRRRRRRRRQRISQEFARSRRGRAKVR